MTRIGPNTFEGPRGGLLYFDGTKFVTPAVEFLRVPLYEDVRFVGPVLAAAVLVLFLTLLAWPVLALWRRWRKVQLSSEAGLQRMYATTRIAALPAVVVVIASTVIRIMSTDATIFSDALDPVLVTGYALAWLTLPSALAVAWMTAVFWQRRIGGLWTRMHQTLMAGSLAFLAWFFITFHIAGTTLNY